MDELEISKTLPQLTAKQAVERTKRNKTVGVYGPIGLYLHVKQGGIQAERTTMPKYCDDVYGIDVRTGQYWMTRVQAMMILKNMSEEELLRRWTAGEDIPKLPPQDVSTQIVKEPDPGKARLAWERFEAIRDEPTLAVKGNGASFKRLLGHGSPTSVGGELNSHLRDQKPPKTAISPPAATAPNTQYTGPWCGACGDVCKPGETLCDDCKTPPIRHVQDEKEEMCARCGGKKHYAAFFCDTCQPIVAASEQDEDKWDAAAKLEATELRRAWSPPTLPPMKSIAVLTACDAVNHKSEFYWTLHLRDGNGKEYTAVVSQKMMDLAPIK